MNLFASMNDLLKRPDDVLGGSARRSLAFLGGAILCYVVYAVAAGTFQGGASVMLAVLKIPIVILASIALCLPSFYVFTALAGADYSARQFATALSAFAAIAGLILLALMPIIWLFSVSSMSLGFVVWMHLFVWLIALVFARRVVVRTAPAAQGAVGLWLVLLFLVSLQMTTYLRPVLWRAPGAPLFEAEKKSFVAHLHEVTRWTPPAPPQQSKR